MNATSFLMNWPPSAAIGLKIPQEVWSSRPIDYSNLRIFGCPEYVYVNNCKLE